VVPDPRELDGLTIDLASQRYGGAVVASSDDFYTSSGLLNRPDQARTMGEGWETQRRRDGGPDHAVFRLGLAGQVRQLIVDTAHFKYNSSAAVELWACADDPVPAAGSAAWQPLLARTRLQPDTRHVLPVASPEVVTCVRVDAFPDGGLSRVRVIGAIAPAARVQAGYRWFNSLPAAQAAQALANAGVPAEAAAGLAARRPLAQDRAGALPGVAESHLRVLAAFLDGRAEG
jgi:allantoicase